MSKLQIKTVPIDLSFNVLERLDCLRQWKSEYEYQEERLLQRVDLLQENNPDHEQISAQIATTRALYKALRVREPLVITANTYKTVSPEALRHHLVEQFARLSIEQRLAWLDNFRFIFTPDLQTLCELIEEIWEEDEDTGQQLHLLGGISRNGKTKFLEWLTAIHMPSVEHELNRVPFAYIEAPVTNHTPKPLLQRLILTCGRSNLTGSEEALIYRLCMIFQKCRTQWVLMDEIEHITRHELRRRVMELSNKMPWLKFIVASCNPHHWVEGDDEVKGRSEDPFMLKAYKGDRLIGLLQFIELLLPFTSDSFLDLYELETRGKKVEKSTGPAQLIEEWTEGVMKRIIRLIRRASKLAIQRGEPNLSIELLGEVWKKIHKTVDDDTDD